MTFYRTYRPQLPKELDNIAVSAELEKLTHKKTADLPHAYLLYGPRGTGKTTTARIIAKIFNCLDRKIGSDPCGRCEQCISISAGTNLDVMEMDAASNRGIDEVRLLRERIGLAPSAANYTIYIIDEVHMLTSEAFNALLKTLEEPPPHAVFVLATTEVHKIPVTVKSRCTVIQFKTATVTELQHALTRIISKEKITIEEPALGVVIAASDGSFRDAVKTLEHLSLLNRKITLQDVNQSLALADQKLVDRIIELLINGQARIAMETIITASAVGTDMKQLISGIIHKLAEILTDYALGKQTHTGIGPEKVKLLINNLTVAYQNLKVSPVAYLPLLIAIMDADLDPAPIPKAEVKKVPVSGEPPAPKNVKEDDSSTPTSANRGLITLEKLNECWSDLINDLKDANHSIAGVLRSARPKGVAAGTVTIEAFYKFHQEKLNEPRVKELISKSLKKLFGETVTILIILGKK